MATGSVGHTLLGGVEVGRQVTDNFRNTGFFNGTETSLATPLASPTVSTPVTFRQSATDADNRSEYHDRLVVRAGPGAALTPSLS